jgi:hypothetical protein
VKQHSLVLALAYSLVVLLAGCGKEDASDGPITDAGVEVPPTDTGDACAVSTPPASTCTQPLALSSCAKAWEGSTAPSCTIDRLGFTVYTGPSNGYLLRSSWNGLVGGNVCFYDPVSKTLVSQFQSGDIVLYCCHTSASIWSGPPLPSFSFTPGAPLCDATDGGASPTDVATD